MRSRPRGARRRHPGRQPRHRRADQARRRPGDGMTEIARELAVANQILVAQGVLDAFGHVSVRCARDPERLLLTRNTAPANVRPTTSRCTTSTAHRRRPAVAPRAVHPCRDLSRTTRRQGDGARPLACVIPFGVSTTPDAARLLRRIGGGPIREPRRRPGSSPCRVVGQRSGRIHAWPRLGRGRRLARARGLRAA